VKIPRGPAAVKWSPFKNVTEFIGKAEWMMILSQKNCLLFVPVESTRDRGGTDADGLPISASKHCVRGVLFLHGCFSKQTY